MFYSETLSSPISSYNVKRLYGVNPDNDPARAALIGIYPLTEVPDGYAVSHYTKENNRWIANPHCITIAEMEKVMILRQLETTLSQLRTAFGLPAEAEEPQAINGYYPLYTSEAESDYHSDNGESHTHEFDGVTYYMPDSGVTLYHGDYPDPDASADDSGDSGDSSGGGY